MGRYVEGEDRRQVTLLPECLEDFITEDNPVRIIDAFVEELELASLGFEGTTPATTGRLAPDFKTIAEFRRGNGDGIRNVCRRFVTLCRDLKLFTRAIVAIDSSKFKAVNSRDQNFTPNKIERRQQRSSKAFSVTLMRSKRRTGRNPSKSKRRRSDCERR